MLRQLLSQYEFFTCKPQIEPLSPEELLLTWKKLAMLGLGQTIPKGRLVFRREEKKNLYMQLNCDVEELLFSRKRSVRGIFSRSVRRCKLSSKAKAEDFT